MASLRDQVIMPVSSLRQASLAGGGYTPDEALEASASLNSPFEAGAKGAIRGTIGGMKGLAAGVMDAYGADPTDMYAAAQRDAEMAGIIGPQVQTTDQINGGADAAAYALGHMGSALPYLATGVGGGLAARGLNRVMGGGLAPEMAAHLGASASFAPMMAGDQILQMKQNAPDMDPVERLQRGLVTGMGQAAVEAAVPTALMRAPGLAQPFWRGLGQQVAVGAASEAGSDVLGQANRMDYQPGQAYDPRQTFEAAAAGAIGTAPYAAPGAAVGRLGYDGVKVGDLAGRLGRGAAEQTPDIELIMQGARALGGKAYDALPETAQEALKSIAATGQMTADTAEALKPHFNNLADATKDILKNYYEDTKKNLDEYGADRAAGAPPSVEEMATDAHANLVQAGASAVAEGKNAYREAMDDPAVPSALKSMVDSGKTLAERLTNTASSMDNPTEWLNKYGKLTPELTKSFETNRSNPRVLDRYAADLEGFLDQTGLDTPASHQLRRYIEDIQSGRELSADEVKNFWAKSKLAAGAARDAESLDKLLNFKGVKLKTENGKTTADPLSKQRDTVNAAVREALKDAQAGKPLIDRISNNIQTADILSGKKITETVRDAVTRAVKALGIDPKADNTYTRMYDATLKAVQERVAALKDEGTIKLDEDGDSVSSAFNNEIRSAFTDMLQNTERGREMAGSETMVAGMVENLTKYVQRLVSGDLGDAAAAKLRAKLETLFNTDDNPAGTRAIDRIIDAAAAEYGGLGDKRSEAVAGLMNHGKTLAQASANIRKYLRDKGDKPADGVEGRVDRARQNSADISALIDDVESMRKFDESRLELPKRIREMRAEASKHAVGTDARWEANKRIQEVSKMLDKTGVELLAEKWVGNRTVEPKNAAKLIEAVEAYMRNDDRITTVEKKTASDSKAANHVKEDENDYEGRQTSAEADHSRPEEDSDTPIKSREVDGKEDGRELQSFIEKRMEEKYGVDGSNTTAAPIWWGTNAFDAGGHKADKVSAPVTRHASGDYGEHSSQYTAAVEEAHAKYGHRVTKAHGVSVQRWAQEMQATDGVSARQRMNEAMKALLAHDQERLKNTKLTDEDKLWINNRADLAERLGDSGNAGEQFFANKINRNYRYYKMEQHDASNLSYNAEQLEATAALRSRTGADGIRHVEEPGAFVERMQKRDGNKFDDEVYTDSLLPLKTADGRTLTVDIAKLVTEAMARHQDADIIGVGEKKVAPNLAQDMVTAFNNVMTALLTGDGMAPDALNAEGSRVFQGLDASPKVGELRRGKNGTTYTVKSKGGDVYNTHFDPNMVIFRDPTGRVLQEGEHASHSVQRAYRLRDLTKIEGFDPETLETMRKNVVGKKEVTPGKFSESDLGTIIQPAKKVEKDSKIALNEKLGNERGVAYRGAVDKEGKPATVDVHHMLNRMLERNGMDPYEVLQGGTLPAKLAGMLLREGFAELQKKGLTGELFNLASTKYDDMVVYHKNFGSGEPAPVTFKDLKRYVGNADAVAPRSMRDAKLQEAVELLKEKFKVEQDAAGRAKRNASTDEDQSSDAQEKRALATEKATLKTDFDYGQPTNQDYSGGKWRTKERDTIGVTDDGKRLTRTTKEREDGDTPKHATDEGINMQIAQILKELGEDAQGDTPLFDKTDAVGRGDVAWGKKAYGGEGKHAVKGEKPKKMGELPEPQAELSEAEQAAKRAARDNLPNPADELKNRIIEAAGKDSATAQLVKDTFGMSDKEFDKFLAGKTAAATGAARAQNKAGEYAGKAGESVKPLTLAEQRAAAKLAREQATTNAADLMNDKRAAAKAEAKQALKNDELAEIESHQKGPKLTPEERFGTDDAAPAAKAAAAPVDGKALAGELATRPVKTPQDSIREIKALDAAQLKDMLTNLPVKPADGTVASQMVKLLNSTGTMKEWADGVLKRAGITRDQLGGKDGNPFSKQRTTGSASAHSEAELAAAKQKLFGDAFGFKMEQMPEGVSGMFNKKDMQAIVSSLASDRLGTLHHEGWHGVETLLGDMGENGKAVLDEVYKHVSTPLMKRWLNERFADDKGVLGQLGDAKERAAFAFQLVAKGEKMPLAEATKTRFQKVIDWVRKMAGKMGFETTTNGERAENFFEYLKSGDFARDYENSHAVRKGMGEKSGDNLMRKASEILAPVAEGLEKVFEHSTTRIQKLDVPEYNELLRKFGGESGKGGYLLDTTRHNTKFGNEITALLHPTTPEQRLAALSSGKLTPFIDKVVGYMAGAGVDAKARTRLFKQIDSFNSERIADEMEDFVTDLIKHGGLKGKPGEARKIASDIADRGYFYDPELKLFADRPDIAERWLEKDPMEKMERFIDRATYLAERTRNFGAVKEYTTPEGTKYRQNEGLHDLLEAGDAKTGPEGRTLIRDYIDAMDGRLGAGKLSPQMKKLQGTLLFAQNVHVLPLAVFSQVLEPLQMAMRKNNMRGSLDSLFRGIRDMPKTFDAVNKRVAPDYWEKLSYQVGSAPNRIIRNVMTNLINGQHVGGKVGEFNESFFKYNFMDQWNRSMHIEGTKHAVEFLREHADNVRAKRGEADKDGSLRSKRYLDELGVTPEDIKFNANDELVLNDKVERAIVQFVDEALAHPDPGSNAMWMNDGRFALLAQMKRFTFAHTKYILGRGIKEAKLGNSFPLAPAIIAMPWMMAADGLRDTLTGAEGYQSKGALDYAKHAAERAGHFGRGQFGLDVDNAIGRGGSPVEALAGPSAEMFGNIARGAHNGHLIDAMLDYTPGGAVVQAL